MFFNFNSNFNSNSKSKDKNEPVYRFMERMKFIRADSTNLKPNIDYYVFHDSTNTYKKLGKFITYKTVGYNNYDYDTQFDYGLEKGTLFDIYVKDTSNDKDFNLKNETEKSEDEFMKQHGFFVAQYKEDPNLYYYMYDNKTKEVRKLGHYVRDTGSNNLYHYGPYIDIDTKLYIKNKPTVGGKKARKQTRKSKKARKQTRKRHTTRR